MQRKLMLIVAAVLAAWGLSTPAAADETADSAVWLLKKTTLVHRDGRHNVLLRALRQMRDPRLKPLFSELVQRRHPVMQIHGVLGLAEIDPEKKIDLALVADVKDSATQAQLVSSAIESDLLTVDQAKQLLTWPGLSEPVKVIVAAYLTSKKQFTDSGVLDESLKSENPAMQGMAAMLKLQLGHADAIRYLDELNQSDKPNRLQIQAMLLQTAIRYEFDKIGPWAMKLAQDPEADRGLDLLALRTAVHFAAAGGAKQGAAVWTKHFDSTTSAADRIRLAMLAVDLSEKLPADMYSRLAEDDQALIRQLGVVGKTIAEKKDAAEPILKLLDENNILAGKWVLQYADDQPIDKATPILVGVILSAEGEPDPPQFRAQRLENVVIAAEMLSEKADNAGAIIHALLEKAPMLTQEAMVMGLIRSDAAHPDKMIEGYDTWQSDTAASLALLLRAKNADKLTPQQLDQLGLIVRGGAGLQEPLRVQAAWIYVKLTDQDKVTLANVLGK